MRRKRIILSASAIALLVIILIIAVRSGRRTNESAIPPEAATQPISVQVLTVGAEMMSSALEMPGTVEPYAEAQLAPKIMSTVHQVYVREGDRVRKGQTLIVLEHEDLSAGVSQAQANLHAAEAGRRQAREAAGIQEVTSTTRVKQAEAQLGAARAAVTQSEANLDLVREGSRKQQKVQAAQGVAQAEAQYELARASYERMERLHSREVIAKQRLDEAKAQHDVALAALNSAKQQQSIVDEGSRAQEEIMAEQALRQARGQVEIAEQNLRAARAASGETAIKREQVNLAAAQAEQAKAGLTHARVQQGYAIIYAPFDGVVTAKNVDPGAMVAPGSPLMTVQSVNRFRLSAAVPEDKAQLAMKGAAVTVVLDSLPGRTFKAQIDIVVPAADPQSRTFVVKASLPADSDIKSGAFGRLLLPGRGEVGIYVPQESIWRSGQLSGVYTVGRDNIANLRLVTLGRLAVAQYQVLSGLSDGDVIVVGDISRISDGARVAPKVVPGVSAAEDRL